MALYQPIVLPVSISALGLLLISAGAHQPSSGRVSGSGSRASARARSRRRTWSPPRLRTYSHPPVADAAGVFHAGEIRARRHDGALCINYGLRNIWTSQDCSSFFFADCFGAILRVGNAAVWNE